jgi:cytochrome c553
MRQALTVVALCILSFVAGAIAMRIYDLGLRGGGSAPSAPAIAGNAVNAPAAPAVVDFTRQPLWAYGFLDSPKPGDKATPQAPPSRNLRPNEDANEQTRPRQLPGSSGSFSLVDIRDGGNVVDWYPGDHPAMPDIIKHGPAKMKEGRRGCGFCHLPNGLGRPENAPVSALPPAYFAKQLHDFRDGLRHSADPRKPNTNTMVDLARAMTEEEITEAARYFAAISWSPTRQGGRNQSRPQDTHCRQPVPRDRGSEDRADRRPHHRSARG